MSDRGGEPGSFSVAPATGELASERARNASWQRYWRVFSRFEAQASSPRDLYADRILEVARGQRWLDAGCGRHSFPEWRAQEEDLLSAAGTWLVGCDSDMSALRDRRDRTSVCEATLEKLPFADGSFGLISSNMVFEHLVHPEEVVCELVRVTKPGGRILIHTVNSWHYISLLTRITPLRFHQWAVARIEGRAAVDVYPTQYRANTVRRLDGLFEAFDCRRVWGGAICDLPPHVPYRGIFWFALFAGILERKLARVPVVGTLARSNLLVEFQRS
jgi:ubiquinone/menaquinone biosynthesis C-methylase UbiE